MGRGAPRFLAKCQPLEVAPSVFNPLGVMGRTSLGGRGHRGANSYWDREEQLPTHPSLRSPPPGNAEQSW